MASASFSFSVSHGFAATSPQHAPPTRLPLRVSDSYATAERTYPNTTQTSSFYELLGVQMGANSQEIKSAYQKLARVIHPDVASNRDEDTSADEFIKVHAAYSTLADPEKRAVYDSTLFRRGRRVADLSVSGFPAYDRRGISWETDQCW